MADGSVVAGPPGSVSTPEAGAETGQYPAGKVTPFHSHPSGTSGGGPQLDPFGGNSSIGSSSVVRYRQAPSILDVNKASSNFRYIFAKGEGSVYIYNDQGVRATIPSSQFVNPKK